METLTRDNIDKHFSPELLALMGEWFAYYLIAPQNGLAWDEVPTIRNFFETGRISAHGSFSDMILEDGSLNGKPTVYLEFFLKEYGIIGDGHDAIRDYCYLKPIVGYDDVKDTFRKNLSSSKTAIFPQFAGFSRRFLPQTESVAFSCDVGCLPLIEAFCAEGYMARRGTTFHWTPKIRAMMEILGVWKSEKDLDLDAKAQAKEVEEAKRVMSILDRLYEDAFEEGVDNEDLWPLIKFVKEYPSVISFSASRELEELGVVSVIPIIGLIMLFDRLGSSLDPDTIEEDLSETSEAMKTLQRSEFRKVIELFRPERIAPNTKKDEPPKAYQLVWRGD